MSKYDDKTHCENLDSASPLEIGQADYLLNPPRIVKHLDLVAILILYH